LKKSSTIQILHFLSDCRKNILINFIDKKVFSSELFYVTSDLRKILRRFNSYIQVQKLIVINKIDISSENWYKYNNYFKLLIIENYLIIKHKGLKSKVIKNYIGFMILNNHNVLLQIEIEDCHIVCFNVSSWYKDNITYFK